MQFDEKRYAQKRLIELQAKKELAAAHGGDVAYFDILINLWEIYLKRLELRGFL